MANRLQLKRGTTTPGNIFYAGEPVYNESAKVLYIGDAGGTGTGAGSSVASYATYAASLEMLYKSSSADSGAIRFYEDTDNGTNFITLKAPAAVTSTITLTLPDSDGDANQVLKTDGSGALSWVDQPSTATFAGDSGIGTVSTAQTLTVSGTANEIETSVSNQTITIGLPNNVTIGNDLVVNGNLRVVGTAVTFETQTVRVEDRLIELGLVAGAAPTATTTWDTGVAFNYFQTSAKKSGLVWLNNQFMAMLSELSDGGGIDSDSPQITATTYAPVAAGGLYIGGIASGNEVINSSQEAVNLTFDGGSY